MGKIAFVFSGQGAQYSGMGKSLSEASAAAGEVFAALDRVRPGTSQQCFQGSAEDLAQTENTQPCLFAVELAAASALRETGITCDMTAGFSLGELSALTWSGAVSLEEGFQLVCKRGQLMQAAASKADTGMAAVLKLSAKQVEALCANHPDVYPVNYNCPGQVAVAGLREAMPGFTAAVKEAGGRAIPLKVSGGFHSPFMASAAAEFAPALEQAQIKEPVFPLYSNCTGERYGGDPRALLAKQIASPVRWQTIIENMVEQGVDIFVELGPGTTLCGLIRKINSEVRTFHVEDAESLLETKEALISC